MSQRNQPERNWKNRVIAITGANGSLGKALTKKLRDKGASIIGLTHSKVQSNFDSTEGPNEWQSWQCGKEEDLINIIERSDILVLNHGINPKGKQSSKDLKEALEINALSSWKLIELFEQVALRNTGSKKAKEIWVNTSEAEIQPALSPTYEISKRLIGEITSLRWNNLNKSERSKLIIRKLILGPFNSKLNPIGLMNADFVAAQIIRQTEFNFNLIIVSPNPLTYILMPALEGLRSLYSSLLKER